MELTWQIREANAEDAEGLKACMESAYTSYQDRMGGIRLPPMDTNYASEINNYPSWIVELDGSIVGGLIMSFDNHKASLANIAVDPIYQGKGIGGALMKFAESKAKENNFSEIHLTTHVLLDENLSLYRHLGWKEISRDESKVFMEKEL